MSFRITCITTFLVMLAMQVMAQENYNPLYHWVSFTDKNGTPYNLQHPEAFLSQRAIQRRINQGIAINEQDLPVNPAYIDSLTKDISLSFIYASRWFNGALVKCPDIDSVARIRSLPFVADVVYVKPAPSKQNKVVSEKKLLLSKSVILDENPVFAYSAVFTNQVNASFLHDDGYLGDGMVIAVLDAGFAAVDSMKAFDQLRNNGQILATRDFVNPGDNFYSTHLHGTYVLSVMAAQLPGLLRGTAPRADYLLIRTEDGGSEFVIEEYNWLVGAELADSLGADIINSSLGYTRFDDPAQNYTYNDMDGLTTVVARAANMAAERGVLVVNSAGNYARQSWQYIGSPADSELVFSIGAVDPDSTRTTFSSVGPTADGRLKPDAMAMGRFVTVAGAGDTLWQVAGTSFSSPIIAGMAACLWQKFPNLKAQQIKEAIIRSGSHYNNPDNAFGHGIPDFEKASFFAESLAVRDINRSLHSATLFPNPVTAKSVVEIYILQALDLQIRIYNTVGQTISLELFQLGGGLQRIHALSGISDLKEGIYFVELSGRGFPKTTLKALVLN